LTSFTQRLAAPPRPPPAPPDVFTPPGDSATTQPGATPPVGIDTFFSSKIVCCVPQIQIPSNPNFPLTCVGGSSVATLNVCNTGKADLEVTSITSSNAQFSVTTPSSGFPVIISPDFCFPFEARFTPTSAGSKTTTLTINSNDPVNPAVMRTFSAQGGQPAILVNDPITFDKTCPGSVNNKTLTIGNSGSCDLIVTGVTSSSPVFKVIGVVPFPLVIPPGATRDVMIQFMPMGFTVDPMQMATLTIMSNDPVTPKLIPGGGTLPVQIRFKPQKKGLRTAKLIVFGHDPATSTILLMETFPLKGVGN
jgi:Abnormal spindle-like microcephaly-assoc'd, ASPM-SPD-2-Hydin